MGGYYLALSSSAFKVEDFVTPHCQNSFCRPHEKGEGAEGQQDAA
jgi:hypothetical protein